MEQSLRASFCGCSEGYEFIGHGPEKTSTSGRIEIAVIAKFGHIPPYSKSAQSRCSIEGGRERRAGEGGQVQWKEDTPRDRT